MMTSLPFLANCLGNMLLMQGLSSTLSNMIRLPAAIIRCSPNQALCVTSLYLFRMSKAAGEIIQKFYLKLRDHNTSADSTPITARQLESLVRLAQARARVDLREDITVQDAMVSEKINALYPMSEHTCICLTIYSIILTIHTYTYYFLGLFLLNMVK